MKMVIAKKWHEISKLGEATFTGVPIIVPDDFQAKSGAIVKIDQKKMLDVAIGGDVIQRMNLEIAKQDPRRMPTTQNTDRYLPRRRMLTGS